MKNNIKTPRKWNEYKYEAAPQMSYFKKKKMDLQPSTMTFSNYEARSEKHPGHLHNNIYFTQANKPNHGKLIFNCPFSHAESMQKSIHGHSSKGQIE